jgi:hypothetical protein
MWSQDGRTFVITWFDPKPGMENEIDAVDRVTLSADGATLRGNADDGAHISATRTSHALLAVAAPSGTRSATATAVASASSAIVRLRPRRASDAGMAAYNGLGASFAAAQARNTAAGAVATPGSVAANGPATASAAAPASAQQGAFAGTSSSSIAAGATSTGGSSPGTSTGTYAGAAVMQSPKAPGPPSVSPVSVSFTAVNQKVVLSVSLPGYTDAIGFCLAPGNCALGASSAPWSCQAQIALTTPMIFQGPGPVTIVMYGPNREHVSMDCVFYVQAPYGTIMNYYSTKVLVTIRIP